MIRSQKYLRLCNAAIVLILVFIWGNSLMSAEVSHALSEWVKSLLKPFLAETAAVIQEENPIVRKLAHFAEFAALGFCLTWRSRLLGKPTHGALLSGCGAAALDETIQLFVPDRGPGIADVLLDSTGVLAGMLLFCLGHTLLKKKHPINNTMEDTK